MTQNMQHNESQAIKANKAPKGDIRIDESRLDSKNPKMINGTYSPDIIMIMGKYLENMATKAELEELRGTTKEEFANVRSEMKEEFANVRSEMKEEFANVRGEMREEFAKVRGEIKEQAEKARADNAEVRAKVEILHEEVKGIKRDFQLTVYRSAGAIIVAMFIIAGGFASLMMLS